MFKKKKKLNRSVLKLISSAKLKIFSFFLNTKKRKNFKFRIPKFKKKYHVKEYSKKKKPFLELRKFPPVWSGKQPRMIGFRGFGPLYAYHLKSLEASRWLLFSTLGLSNKFLRFTTDKNSKKFTLIEEEYI